MYSGTIPEFIDGNVFKTKISLNGTVNGTVNDTVNGTVNANEQSVLNLIRKEEGLNATEISKRILKSVRTTKRYLKSLNNKKLIEFKGAPKTGGYYIKKL